MLIHITHRHDVDHCAYDHPDRAKRYKEVLGHDGSSGAKVVGSWVDAPAHTVFLLVEAQDVEAVEALMAPIMELGTAEVRPVVEGADIVRRRAEG